MIQVKNIFKGALVVLILLILVSCGKGDSVTATYGSTILASPDTFTVNDGSGSTTIHDKYFTITVVDEFGEPKSNIEIFIDFLWSSPDVYNSVQLYDGNTPVNAPMKVTTDDSGTYHLRIDFASGNGLDYFGDIQIISASATQASISVTVGI